MSLSKNVEQHEQQSKLQNGVYGLLNYTASNGLPTTFISFAMGWTSVVRLPTTEAQLKI